MSVEEIKKALEELCDKIGTAYDKGDNRLSNLAFWSVELGALRCPLESLQRENEALKRARYDLAYAITGGEDAPGLLDSVPTSQLVEIARDTHRRHSADIDRAEAAEFEVKRYRVALIAAKTRMRNCRGAIESDQVIDKDVHGSLQNGIRDIEAALASTGGEHHGN